ncbi:hypothetical protein KUTeg_013922 [Tegillarca granosa]|uniref:PLAT domain-containing protein n=1 Tax=Tegillarca granosa TaxID=220873 RepID=A0ABQ9EV29_TEGGR|nr:hypothetical protein KUTeg_013922 [Tegillarca granosa]
MDFSDNTERKLVRTWAGKMNTELYGSNLKSLCRRTQENLNNLSQLISRGDPCVKYGIKHWHPDRPSTARGLLQQQSDIEQTNVKCKNKSVMFTCVDENQQDTSDVDSVSSYQSAMPANTFCYLCTTLEEHERHMLLNRRPSSAKARIEYVAPKPRIKKEVEEEEEEYAKENLYRIDVYTGDIDNAGTDAQVSITIKGSRDILPKTPLKKSRGSSKFTFLRNTKETFYIKGPKLGNLEIVTIEHDGLEKKHGWYLDRIEITEIRFDQTWIFLCNQWLSMHIKDYQIKRDLIGKEREAPMAEYLITVETGKKRLAGTDAHIYLTLYGKYGASKKIHLVDKNKKIIEHDGKGLASGWFLDKIIINYADNPKNIYYFIYNGWIAKDVGDGLLWREIRAKKTLPKEVSHGTKTMFTVTVQTGNVRYAGTDANVFIQITGSKGMTEKIQLDDAKNNFEKGMVDEFQVELFDVGKIEKINIGHDSSGPGAGWFLDWVRIRRQMPKQDVIEHLKHMKKKIAALKKKKGRQNDNDDLEDSTGIHVDGKLKRKERKSYVDDDEEDKKRKQRKYKTHNYEDESEISMRVPLYEEYEFICKKWLAEDEGDGLTERELPVNKMVTYYKD